MNLYQKIYYYGFVIVCVINFSPFKTLAYFSPFIFLGLLFLFTEEKPRIVLRGIYFLLISIILFYIYYLTYPTFVIQNFLLAILTYSSFYPLFFVNQKKIANKNLLNKMLKFSLIVFSLEAFWSLVQAVYGFYKRGYFFSDSGDFVEGTIHPQLSAEMAFSNPMFAVNMAILLLGVLILIKLYKTNVKIGFILGVLSLLLASVIHVIIFFVIAVLISAIIFYKNKLLRFSFLKLNWRFSSYVLTGIISTVIVVLIFNRREQIVNIGKQYLLNEVPRAIVTNSLFSEIIPENIEVIFIGLGPGQFSSRASLIGSGNYLGGIDNPKSVPFLKSRSNYFSDTYVIAQIEATADIKYFGSSQQPFYSWLSIISEFGIIAFIFVICFVIYLIKKLKIESEKKTDKRYLSFITSTGIVFIFFLGIQENYYEIPQAIFNGILLLLVMYANVVYSSNEFEK